MQELLDAIENIPILGPMICETYLPGNGCKLPMLPGHYGMAANEEPFYLPILNLQDFVLKYLMGTWEVKIEMYNESLKEIMCEATTLKFNP